MKVKGEQLWMWECKRERGREKGNKGVHVIKVCYIYVWKYHNETRYFV
jgi:hypothetical protein